MTEPVAYMIRKVGETLFLEDKPSWASNSQSTPLYTAEQLHPRVKMNSDEFDEFHDLFEKDFDLYSAITEIADTNLCTTLYDRLFTGTSSDKAKQNEFADLWASYNPMEPEETIEIVPETKWFVQIKNKNEPAKFLRKTEFNVNYIEYGAIKLYAQQFDTKEEAEKWTNPLTEAVQLPVEE